MVKKHDIKKRFRKVPMYYQDAKGKERRSIDKVNWDKHY